MYRQIIAIILAVSLVVGGTGIVVAQEVNPPPDHSKAEESTYGLCTAGDHIPKGIPGGDGVNPGRSQVGEQAIAHNDGNVVRCPISPN